jgi:ankyrin repeat protein
MCPFRNIEAVEQILKRSPPDIVNKLDPEFGQPALHYAVLAEGDERSEQLIKLLIRHGANIRFKDSVDQSVLFYVCREGKNEIT